MAWAIEIYILVRCRLFCEVVYLFHSERRGIFFCEVIVSRIFVGVRCMLVHY